MLSDTFRTYEGGNTQELMHDLQELFDLESFAKTIETLKHNVSDSYLDNLEKTLNDIFKLKIHKFSSTESYEYEVALYNKLSLKLKNELNAKKLKLFLDFSRPLVESLKKYIHESIDANGKSILEFKPATVIEYIKSSFDILKPLADVPTVIETSGAIVTLQNIHVDGILMKIENLKRQVSLLTRYIQELTRTIETLYKQLDIKNPKERDQIDNLKTQKKNQVIKLANLIGLLSSLYCQIQENDTGSEDKKTIEELFDMNNHINPPLLDKIFIEIIQKVLKQVIVEPKSVEIGYVFKSIPDSDLSRFKRRFLTGDVIGIIQRIAIVGGNFINLLSEEIPIGFNRDLGPNNRPLNTKQSVFTKGIIASELAIELTNLYYDFTSIKNKNSSINAKITNMHQEIIKYVFQFLGKQIESEKIIHSLYNQYQLLLDTTALNKQGIKSDFENDKNKFELYDKISNLFDVLGDLISFYEKIRLEYNLPSQLVMETLKSKSDGSDKNAKKG